RRSAAPDNAMRHLNKSRRNLAQFVHRILPFLCLEISFISPSRRLCILVPGADFSSNLLANLSVPRLARGRRFFGRLRDNDLIAVRIPERKLPPAVGVDLRPPLDLRIRPDSLVERQRIRYMKVQFGVTYRPGLVFTRLDETQ